MTRIFLDCEFTGLTQNTSLISIALYIDDDQYFYAEFSDYKTELLTTWIEENVLTKLLFRGENDYFTTENNIVKIKDRTATILERLKIWLSGLEDIEIWGDVPTYDWMLFCELFGGALNIPGYIHYIPFDIATLGKMKLGLDDFSRFEYVNEIISEEEKRQQHNALIDAKIEKLCFEKMMKHHHEQ